MNKLTIHCDGASRGNPGPAAAGFVVLENGKEVFKDGRPLGVATNNIAEYSAVIEALKWLDSKDAGEGQVELVLDSLLVVNQLKGLYKIKNKNLLTLSQQVKLLEKKISPKIIYKNVSRDNNTLADSLVNEILDSTL